MSDQKLVVQLKRRLWVIHGVLDQGIEEEKLNTIVKLHEKIGTVPDGYMQPQLY